MKDNFSTKSDQYAKFRPIYPKALFDFIKSNQQRRERVWDCATGNGQMADGLADFFTEVHATDISESQLSHAIQKPNIHYTVQAAEKTDFPDAFFDLVVVAQAIHWFDFERFYAEVRRTTAEGAYLFVIGYELLTVSPEIDELILFLYRDILGEFWDPERRYLEESYRTIPFPFEEIEVPVMEIKTSWDKAALIGYLKTWSAVKHYQKKTGVDPLVSINEKLDRLWTEDTAREVVFPVLLRAGKVK